MFKIISAFCLVLAVAKGQEDQDYFTTTFNPPYGFNYRADYRSENFLTEHQRQHDYVIEIFDLKLKHLENKIPENINDLNIKRDYARKEITETTESLSALEFLSDSHKSCVSENYDTIPTISNMEDKIRTCSDNFKKSVDDKLFKTAKEIRDTLEYYYKDEFAKKFNDCDETDHYRCIDNVVNESERLTREKQKDFDAALETDDCIIKAAFKRLIQCGVDVYSETLKDISSAKYMIHQCVTPKDECKPCTFDCREDYLRVDLSEKEITNPFYKNSGAQCVLLENGDSHAAHY